MRVFVTGRPGVGKTTALVRAAERLRARGLEVGGFVTREFREGGARAGFLVLDLGTGEGAILARVGPGEPRVGRYRVLPEGTRFARDALVRALKAADVVVVDEVGPMELADPALAEAIESALRAKKPVLGSVHARTRHPLAERIRREARLFEVTRENREAIPDILVARLLEEGDGRAQEGA